MSANFLLNFTTQTDFASLESFKNMLGEVISKLWDFKKAQWEYVKVAQSATISLKDFDAVSSKLIDTQLALQKSAELSHADFELTSKQYADIAKAATVMSKTTGDANAEFKRLVDALISGREMGLKRYGIEIEKTGDRQVDFTNAVNQLTEKMKDQKLAIDDTAEAIVGFQNDFGTWAGEWERFEKNISKTGLWDQFKNWISGVSNMTAEQANHMMRLNELMEHDTSGVLRNIQAEMEKLKVLKWSITDYDKEGQKIGVGLLEQEQKRLDFLENQWNTKVKEIEALEAQKQLEIEINQELKKREAQISILAQKAYEDAAYFYVQQWLNRGAKDETVKKKRGGGGSQKVDMDFTLEEIDERNRQWARDPADKAANAMLMDFAENQARRDQDKKDLADGFQNKQEQIDFEQQLLSLKMQEGQVTSDQLQQKISYLQQEYELKREMLDSGLIEPDTQEARAIKLEQAQLEHDILMTNKEAERVAWEEQATVMDHAKLAFNQYVDGLSTGGLIASTSIGMINNSMQMMFQALFNAKKGFFEALSFMIRDQAISAAAQAFTIGLLQTVRASEWFSMPFGAGSAQGAIYTGSAAQAYATSAVLLGIAGASHGIGSLLGKINGGNKGSSKDASGSASGSSGMISNNYLQNKMDEKEKIEVVITMKDGAEGFVEAMYSQNENRAKRGARHFSTSEGY